MYCGFYHSYQKANWLYIAMTEKNCKKCLESVTDKFLKA